MIVLPAWVAAATGHSHASTTGREPAAGGGSNRDSHTMRFMGTVKIELADGTVEKFKDQPAPHQDGANDDYAWWTHTFEKE